MAADARQSHSCNLNLLVKLLAFSQMDADGHWCLTGLWREHHDQVAKFLAAMGPKGAEEALRLSGLSLREELRLASSVGQLRRAQHCLEALAWGSGDRATLNAFPLWQSHTIDTLLGGGVGGEPPPPPPSHPLGNTYSHVHMHVVSLPVALGSCDWRFCIVARATLNALPLWQSKTIETVLGDCAGVVM